MNEVRTIDTAHSSKGIKEAIYEGKKQDVVIYPKANCTVFFPAGNIKEVNLSAQSFKILDFLLMDLPIVKDMNRKDMNEVRTIKKSLSGWCELFRIQYQQENIRILKEHLKALTFPIIQYMGHTVVRDKNGNVVYIKDKLTKNEMRKEREKTQLYFHILDDVKITDGYIQVRLNESFIELLADYSYDMIYNPKMFAINTHKNPNAYNFAYKLLIHAKLNKGKKNSNKLSVLSIINCTDIIPNQEDLSRPNSFREKIVKPFERDMNALSKCGILIHEDADSEKNKPEYNGWHYMLYGKKYEGKINAKNFYELEIEFHLDD